MVWGARIQGLALDDLLLYRSLLVRGLPAVDVLLNTRAWLYNNTRVPSASFNFLIALYSPQYSSLGLIGNIVRLFMYRLSKKTQNIKVGATLVHSNNLKISVPRVIFTERMASNCVPTAWYLHGTSCHVGWRLSPHLNQTKLSIPPVLMANSKIHS